MSPASIAGIFSDRVITFYNQRNHQAKPAKGNACMKKHGLSRITAGVTAGIMIGTAAFLPGCNQNNDVYGPPEDLEVTVTPEYEPEENIPVAVYGPPEGEEYIQAYDPGDNVPEDVYGPPVGEED